MTLPRILLVDPRIAWLIILIRAALRPPAGVRRIALALDLGALCHTLIAAGVLAMVAAMFCALPTAGFPCLLLIVRRGFDGLCYHALYPLAAAFLFTVYFLLTRVASGQGTPLSMHDIAAVSGSVVLALWLYGVKSGSAGAHVPWPTDASALVALASLGIISTVSHMAIFITFVRAPASVLAPLNYLEIVSATALSFVIFGTFPDQWTVIGAMLIMAIGYIATRPE